MNRRLPAILALVLTLPAWSDGRYQATGLVLTVDPRTRTILVSNDEIPGFMEAMVMPWKVEPEQLTGLVPGAKISFTLVVTKTASQISNIRVLEYRSTERDPDQNRRLAALETALGEDRSKDMVAVGQTVPDFTLTDQNNREVSLSQFSGKVIAVTFIYTRCPLPDYCFRLSNNFETLQRRFGNRLGRDLVLLSITFDPVHDSPEVLAKYAEVWKARDGWRFLTGPLPIVKHVCSLFGMNFWPDEGLLTHSLRTVLIDRDRKLAVNIEGNQFTAKQLGDLVEVTLDRRTDASEAAPDRGRR